MRKVAVSGSSCAAVLPLTVPCIHVEHDLTQSQLALEVAMSQVEHPQSVVPG